MRKIFIKLEMKYLDKNPKSIQILFRLQKKSYSKIFHQTTLKRKWITDHNASTINLLL